MPRITISYRRDDSLDITGRIFDRLAGHFGREAVFRDIDSIPLGTDFRRHIDRVLDQSDIILAIVGPRWIGPGDQQLRLASAADPVRLEIETALRKDKPLIPVLVSRAVMPHPDVLPESLHDFVYRNAVQVDSGQDFDVHVGRLIRGIEELLRIDEERIADEVVQSAPPIEPTPKAERPAEAAQRAEEAKRLPAYPNAAWNLGRAPEENQVVEARSKAVAVRPDIRSHEQRLELNGTHHPSRPCYQLRAVPREFTGRQEILDQLKADLMAQLKEPHIVGVVNIVGMPGVGKTALANALAHSLVGQFPHAQLFMELGTHSSAPRTEIEVLYEAIRALDPEDKDSSLPNNTLQLKYWDKLSGKKAIVIIDDVRDDAQVSKLLPPPGCATILTSRQRLETIEAQVLDTLAQESAEALLRQYRGFAKGEAHRLIEFCDGLPVALTIIGGQLRKYPTLSVVDLIARLQQSRHGTASDRVEELFEYSYQHLEAAQQRAWRMLSVINEPFWREVGEFVIEGGGVPASALDELMSRSLLLFDSAMKRFSWHDLLRRFAQDKLSLSEKELATERWERMIPGQLRQIWRDLISAPESQQQQMERWQILRDTQTKIFEIQQLVTANQAQAAEEMYRRWDEYIRG